MFFSVLWLQCYAKCLRSMLCLRQCLVWCSVLLLCMQFTSCERVDDVFSIQCILSTVQCCCVISDRASD